MFIFQSSKDKELKRIIDDKFKQAISSEPMYQKNKQLLASYCLNSDKKGIEKLVDLIKEAIKDEESSAKSKYYAIKMLQDVMKTQNKMLGNYVVKKILKRLGIFAQYKKQSKDESRGKSIFGKVKGEQQSYAKKFHLTVLSCLEQWGTTWPRGSDGPHLAFKQKYQQLITEKVTFPKTLSNTSQVLKQKISKDKVDLKGINQPKKFISPQRRQSREKKDQTNFASGNSSKAIDEAKIIQINTLLLNIDETFNLLEQMSLEDPNPQILTPVIESLNKQLLKGDDFVGYLISQNNKEYEPIINDVTSDFEFIGEIKDNLKGLKTQKAKQAFIIKYRKKFEERRVRRNQNQIRVSMIKKREEVNRNSVNSQKSDQKPNAYYPHPVETIKKSSFNPANSLTVEDIQRRVAESNRQSEKSQKQNKQGKVSESASEDQGTGKFKTFAHEEVTSSPQEDIFKLPSQMPQKRLSNENKLAPREAESRKNSGYPQQSSQQLNSQPKIKYPEFPIKAQLNKQTIVPSPESSSSSNIHSTSIMKKLESSNAINQSNSISKQKPAFSSQSPFSGSSKPIKSNPFQSDLFGKKSVQSNNMFSSFGRSSFKQQSRQNPSLKQKQQVFGKIQQNIYESEQNISQRKKSVIGNPFDGDSIFSIEKQKTNPFDSIHSFSQQQNNFQSNNSNPFITKNSFLQKSNPFLSDSISSKSSERNVKQTSNFLRENKGKNTFDKNNTSSSNMFMKKSVIDFHFDLQDEPKKSQLKQQMQHKASLKQMDFPFPKKQSKEDFFAKNQFSQQGIGFEQFDKHNKSLFDNFPVIQSRPAEVETFFGDIKKSNILPKKQMTTSNLDFETWLTQEKKSFVNEADKPQQKYPQLSEIKDLQEYRASDEKNNISLSLFNPPEINIQITPKQSRIAQNKDPSNPWPEIEDLNESEFPIQQNDQNKFPNEEIKYSAKKEQQSPLKNSQKERINQNPFGIPNPEFQLINYDNSPKQDLGTPPIKHLPQVPTTDKESVQIYYFGTKIKQGGSPWNPYKKKAQEAQKYKKNIPIAKFERINLQSQLSQAKQFFNSQHSLNIALKQQFAGERASYLTKLKQLESINAQKIQYQTLIKKSRQTTANHESLIAEQSKNVIRLKALNDKKNTCLKRIFELRNQRQSAKNLNQKSSRNLSSKANKFIAFNETAKNLHSLAISGINSRETIKINSFHHRH